ncbi:MAG: DUF6712 family protein [Salinivirgaceae bacterium]|jgi:hypothetical protein
MIFKTISEIKDYIPTTMVDIQYLTMHETRAMLKHLPKYLGVDLTKQLMVEEPSANNLLLIESLKGAIANLAYLEAVPFIDLVSTKTGFGIVSNQNMAPASAQRVENFKDACLKAADDYLSDALLFLELNSANYPTWNKSSLIDGGLMASIDEWPAEININYSRVKFVNLVPYIKQAERLYVTKKLSPEFVAVIADTDDMDVLPDARKALAFYAVYLKGNDELKDDSLGLKHLNEKNIETANEYLNSCIDFLNTHLETYPVYQEFGYSTAFQNDLSTFGFIKLG